LITIAHDLNAAVPVIESFDPTTSTLSGPNALHTACFSASEAFGHEVILSPKPELQ
jgi:hypothetical protein